MNYELVLQVITTKITASFLEGIDQHIYSQTIYALKIFLYTTILIVAGLTVSQQTPNGSTLAPSLAR